MEPAIAKEPSSQELNAEQIEWLTEIIFTKRKKSIICDAVFVFGGTHPGHWENAIKAYRTGRGKLFIVTGGISPTGKKHAEWEDANKAESIVIKRKMVEAGIPEDIIFFEDTSSNTLENVTHSMRVFDYHNIRSLLVICKAHCVGRQIRTLQKHLPAHIEYHPYGFPAVYHDKELRRDNWHLTAEGRARVWGEYLRICHYGEMGHLNGIPADERLIEI